MPDATAVKVTNFINKIRNDKWNQFLFTVLISGIVGLFAYIFQLSPNLGRITNFAIYFVLAFFLVYVSIAGYVGTVNSSLPNTIGKRIVSLKVMMSWLVSLLSWLVIGGLVAVNLHSADFAQFWLYSFCFLMTAYPCLASLTIYGLSYKYLRIENITVEDKIKFVKALTIITIGLATPWILALFFILAFFPTQIWVEFLLILTIYLSVFFLAIDLPYHQSMEAVKYRMVKGLEKIRHSLVERLCFNCELSERISLELNIQRIDRDIDRIKTKSSHPFSIIKPIAGFVGISIGASVLAGIIVELLKIGLNIA